VGIHWDAMRLLFVLLVTGSDGRWHPGIGDPTVMGWVTVAAYAAAAVFSFEALRASRLGAQKLAAIAPPEAENQRDLFKLWSLVTLAMLVLGLNKQLDLQSLFTEILRDMAKSEGWYEERRTYQRLFIVTIGLVGAAGTLAIGWTLRKVLKRVMGAVLGLGLLVSFVVIRAASFHNVDLLLMRGSIRLNWVLELGGLLMIIVSAYRSGAVIRGATG
jgi:hypothetical protein